MSCPYVLDSEAEFEVAEFQWARTADDVMDVMLTLTINTALGDGVAPDKRRMRAEFPYFGEPYASTQQVSATAQVSEKQVHLAPTFTRNLIGSFVISGSGRRLTRSLLWPLWRCFPGASSPVGITMHSTYTDVRPSHDRGKTRTV